MRVRLLVGAIASSGLIASAAHASLSGAVYAQPTGNTIGTTATAVSDITGTPAVTFVSNNVNGINYTGNDGSAISSVLGADATSAVGNTAIPFGTGVINETGSFVAPVTGTYTFSSNLDDGGGFYVDGNGTPGTGTAVAIDDGDHGQQLVTGTLSLSAGVHQLEYVYYNSACCGYTGKADGTGGGIADSGVTITDPNGVAVVTSPVPEPASIGMLAVGAFGLLARRRRA